MSLARMPDDDFESLQGARYPEVRRKWKEHETLSGHSGFGDGWRSALIFNVVVGSGYGFLWKGSADASR